MLPRRFSNQNWKHDLILHIRSSFLVDLVDLVVASLDGCALEAPATWFCSPEVALPTRPLNLSWRS